jgi:hypothetical protein
VTTTTLPDGPAVARVVDGGVYLTGWGWIAILLVAMGIVFLGLIIHVLTVTP